LGCGCLAGSRVRVAWLARACAAGRNLAVIGHGSTLVAPVDRRVRRGKQSMLIA
jgi:hypothetical protein